MADKLVIEVVYTRSEKFVVEKNYQASTDNLKKLIYGHPDAESPCTVLLRTSEPEYVMTTEVREVSDENVKDVTFDYQL